MCFWFRLVWLSNWRVDNFFFCLGGRNGGEVPDLSALGSAEDMAGLWASYHSALGLAKGKATPPVQPREQSVSFYKKFLKIMDFKLKLINFKLRYSPSNRK